MRNWGRRRSLVGKAKKDGGGCSHWTCQEGEGPHHRRDLVRQLDDVLFQLAQTRTKPVEAIHDARRGLKRARAVAHLVTPPGKKTGPDCLRMMKLSGRLLGPIRDRHVAKAMVADRGRMELTDSDRLIVREVESIVRAVRTQIADYWDVSWVTKRTLRDEAELSYRIAREDWRRAEISGTVEDLHECRKSAKRCYFQLIQLGGGRRASGGRLNEFRRLGDLLGEHHDLWAVNRGSLSGRSETLAEELRSVGDRLFEMTEKKHSHWVKKVVVDATADRPRGNR